MLAALVEEPVFGPVPRVGALHLGMHAAYQILPDRLGALTPLQQPTALRQRDHLARKAERHLVSFCNTVETALATPLIKRPPVICDHI